MCCERVLACGSEQAARVCICRLTAPFVPERLCCAVVGRLARRHAPGAHLRPPWPGEWFDYRSQRRDDDLERTAVLVQDARRNEVVCNGLPDRIGHRSQSVPLVIHNGLILRPITRQL